MFIDKDLAEGRRFSFYFNEECELWNLELKIAAVLLGKKMHLEALPCFAAFLQIHAPPCPSLHPADTMHTVLWFYSLGHWWVSDRSRVLVATRRTSSKKCIGKLWGACWVHQRLRNRHWKRQEPWDSVGWGRRDTPSSANPKASLLLLVFMASSHDQESRS